MIEPILWGAAVATFTAITVGIRRQPWRWCAVVGLGTGIVFWGIRVATLGGMPGEPGGLDLAMLVLAGALGGSLAQFGWDRGELERERRTAAILGRPTT